MDAMPGMTMSPASMSTPAHFAATLLMWSIMMAVMMAPSAVPMLRLVARTAGGPAGTAAVLGTTGLFGAGYLLSWLGFSIGATAAQVTLGGAGLLTGDLALADRYPRAALLALAGAYQLTPWKTACLTSCQTPLRFVLEHWRVGRSGALVMGAHHGALCVGCCWALMALLFVAGVMHPVAIGGLALLVLLEKVVIRGAWFPRTAGVALLAAAALTLLA